MSTLTPIEGSICIKKDNESQYSFIVKNILIKNDYPPENVTNFNVDELGQPCLDIVNFKLDPSIKTNSPEYHDIHRMLTEISNIKKFFVAICVYRLHIT